jgi:NAD+ kinase
LNEALFCHDSPAATSRYILRLVERWPEPEKPRARATAAEEEQKSSGIWVGPAAGSTAAQRSAGGRVLPLASDKLQFVVREPYRPHGEKLALTRALVEPGGALVLKSKMRNSKVFLDGDHIVYDVGIGDVLVMRRSQQPLVVLGLKRNGSPHRH